MKTKLVMLLVLCTAQLRAQSHRDTIQRELVFGEVAEHNTIIIANINGGIRVEGYDGDKIMVEVNRSLTAPTDEDLKMATEEVQLGTIDRGDTIVLYTENRCHTFGKSRQRGDGRHSLHGWGYDWNHRERSCNPPYDYTMNFVVRVPSRASVLASTINNGDITIRDVKGKASAFNVNGSIEMRKRTGELVASTVNGDVTVEFVTNPSGDCRFYTLNGDIDAVFPSSLAASFGFESVNGKLYSNVQQLEPLPVEVVKSVGERGTKYKVTNSRYKIGRGGTAYLDFETFNGDVYLRTR